MIHSLGNEISEKVLSVNILIKMHGEGWDMKEGDVMEYDFEKYPSEVVENQTLLMGYIKDGVLMDDEVFRQLKGTYKLTINELGKYYVYLICVSSDSITLKNGTLKILDRSKGESYESQTA